jgi:hypothetical protein
MAIAAAAAAAVGTPQAFAARQTDPVLPALPSLAEAQVSNYEHLGLHCRSSTDDSNASAVGLLRVAVGRQQSVAVIETSLAPEQDGRHRLIMVYTVEVRPGIEEVRETRGWVDQDTCQARLA